MSGSLTPWHVKVSAEAFAAALFAQCGMDVSVQYGADQPEYDLIVVEDGRFLKVSVKGSQTEKWGLAQSFLKNADYHRAVSAWVGRHKPRTILCLVQFKSVGAGQLPRVYLATPREIAERLNATAKGRGATILYDEHLWNRRARGAGIVERIPVAGRFSRERVMELLFQV